MAGHELLRERVELARDRQGLNAAERALQRLRELAGKPVPSGNNRSEMAEKMPVNAGKCR